VPEEDISWEFGDAPKVSSIVLDAMSVISRSERNTVLFISLPIVPCTLTSHSILTVTIHDVEFKSFH